ncbi:MAG: hypothetical protein QOH32_588 [Bradyrhizobium sp.]|nr:hypothetical protein [Bradyrhizobium sp.]
MEGFGRARRFSVRLSASYVSIGNFIFYRMQPKNNCHFSFGSGNAAFAWKRKLGRWAARLTSGGEVVEDYRHVGLTGFLHPHDAGCNPEAGAGDDYRAISPPAGLQRGARFQSDGIDQGDAAAAAVGDEYLSAVGDAQAAPGNPGRVATCLPGSWSITSMLSHAVCAMKTRRVFASKAAWSNSLPAASGMRWFRRFSAANSSRRQTRYLLR